MISVIVPVYAVEKYIKKCIHSILKQTMEDFELILVDDGSPDKCGKICDAYAKQDNRIRVLHQENQGLSGARNTGLKAAEGEYIAYIDSDDSVEPDYLEELYSNAVRFNAEVSVCGYLFDWETQEIKKYVKATQNRDKAGKVCTYSGREAAAKIVKENERRMITSWGKLYHKSLKPYLIYPEGKTHEDEFVTYRVFYKANRVVVSQRRLYHYLQRGSSIMNEHFNEKRLHKLLALKESIAFFKRAGDSGMELYARKRYLLNLQIGWFRSHRFIEDNKKLLKKIREEWKQNLKKYGKSIWRICGLADKISILIFGISPRLYGVIANVYAKREQTNEIQS
ncbi:MAG: glycosyltransferase family 2 protein [Clostridia bacterium]|jgi:glycosyltransferase involved in cell wall biosynthesis|nr:glycosyltransferase family 2 protein [Lachnospiraceae bacterium]NCC00224.1 glycosyltransferase family 2 protein [Clostridia bacterium]NCD03653.1 glycosyltransferase family 2 protein [Clostridia bacterium]